MCARTGKLKISLALIAAMLFSSQTLLAQDLRNSPAGDWSRLNAVAPGAKLAIKLKSGKGIDGKLDRVSDKSLSLLVKNKPVEINREDIFSVHQVTKKSAAKATLIGLGIGASSGAAIGLASQEHDDFLDLNREITAGLTVVGAGAGALTGWLIGKSGRKKVLIYQAPQP